MLGKPWAGWCTVSIGDEKIGSASYLDWVPGLVITPCVRYLQAIEGDYDYDSLNEKPGFNLEFDAEGYEFGLVEIGDGIYIYDTCGSEEPWIRLHKDVAYKYRNNALFIKDLLKEVCDDIRSCFEDWVMWDAVDANDEKRNRKALEELLEAADEVLCS